MVKDPAIIEMIAKLTDKFGPGAFEVTDHWEADLLAVGLSSKADPSNLVYIALSLERGLEGVRIKDGLFHCDLERRAKQGSHLQYEICGSFDDIDFEKLAQIVASALIS